MANDVQACPIAVPPVFLRVEVMEAGADNFLFTIVSGGPLPPPGEKPPPQVTHCEGTASVAKCAAQALNTIIKNSEYKDKSTINKHS